MKGGDIKKAAGRTAAGNEGPVLPVTKSIKEVTTMNTIEATDRAEAERILAAIEKNAIDGQLKQDTGYLSKILPDVRKLRALIVGDKNE